MQLVNHPTDTGILAFLFLMAYAKGLSRMRRWFPQKDDMQLLCGSKELYLPINLS